MMKNNNCPLCKRETNLYLNYNKINRGDFKLLKCVGCGFIFTYPTPEKNFLNKYYQSYDSTGKQDNYYRNIKEYLKTSEGKELNKFFNYFVKEYRPNKELEVLDLGSGAGSFLDIIKGAGYRELGVEISKPAVKFAQDNFQVNCIFGDAETVDFEAGKFSAVFMWDLLEHIVQGQFTLARINNWLISSGYVVLETPSSGGLINWVILLLLKLKIKWPATWMFGFHHLSLYSELSLKNLLEQNNFKVLKIIKKNTSASRIFPWNLKFFIPRLSLEVVNFLTHIVGKKNKIIIIAQKND